MYLRVSDGIYFEVGGTSTNIGVIRNGRPDGQARAGRRPRDLRQLARRARASASPAAAWCACATASSSMSARAAPTSPVCPTPRSPSPRTSSIPESNCSSRRPSDPDDYVAVRSANGARYAITNTCAANVLGYAKPGWHACGNPEVGAARHGGAGRLHRRDPSRIPRARILEIATDKVIPVVEDLIAEYGLDRDQAVLVGEGGGAAALIPHRRRAHRPSPSRSRRMPR